MRTASRRGAEPLTRLLARAAGVPDPEISWRLAQVADLRQPVRDARARRSQRDAAHRMHGARRGRQPQHRDVAGASARMNPQPIPFLDLARQHAEMEQELSAAFERVTNTSAFILGEEVERFEEEFAGVLRRAALRRGGVGDGRADARPAGGRDRPRRRGDRAGAHVHRERARDHPRGRGAGAVRRRGGHGPARRRVGRRGDERAHRGDPRGAPLRAAVRHGSGPPACRPPRHPRVRGRRPGARRDATRGRKAGALGTAAGFSFYPSKNLGALGDAGAITTDDAEIADRARSLRNLGQRDKGEHVDVGFNERLDGLQAAVLRIKLEHLDEWNEQRRLRAASYVDALDGAMRVLEVRSRDACVYHLFPVRVADRDGLQRRLTDEGVETGVHYSANAATSSLPCAASALRAARSRGRDAWAAEELSLPMYPGLAPADIERVAAVCSGMRSLGKPRLGTWPRCGGGRVQLILWTPDPRFTQWGRGRDASGWDGGSWLLGAESAESAF